MQKRSLTSPKYAAMATPTQEYRYKQDCGVGVYEVACFRSESEYFFLDLIKSESQIGVGFLDSLKLGIGFLIVFGDYNLR